MQRTSAKSYLYYHVLGAAPSFRPNAFVPAIHNMTLRIRPIQASLFFYKA